MVLGPLLRREYRAAIRNRKPFAYRIVMAVVLIGLAGLVAWLMWTGSSMPLNRAEKLIQIGRVLLPLTVGTEVLLLLGFVLVFVAPAIAEERQQDTLSLLLLTRLRPVEIVLCKLLARWLPTFLLTLSSVPILLVAAWLGNLPHEAGLAILGLLSTSLFLAALTILASSQCEQSSKAWGVGLYMGMIWLMFPPIMAVAPITSGNLGSDLLIEIQRLCRVIAPSSPLHLAIDHTWLTAPATAWTLDQRVLMMVGEQMLLMLPLLAAAVWQLYPHDVRPNWNDPFRGYRVPVTDDPILWREFEQPSKHGSGGSFLLLARMFVIHLRALVVAAFNLVGVLVGLLVLVGMVLAFLYYATEAAQEIWAHGYWFRDGMTYDGRRHFNVVVRLATATFFLFPALAVGSTAAGRIVIDRDRKAWDLFLTTPLDGRTILRSKVRAAVLPFRNLIPIVGFVWLTGLILGVVHPVGLLVAGVDLALLLAANLALALNLVIRPGPTATAVSRTTGWTLLLFTCHMSLLFGLTTSPLERATLMSAPTWLLVALVVATLVLMLLTAGIAWLFGRQLDRRFDEWVDRPIRPDPSANPFAPAVNGEGDAAARNPSLWSAKPRQSEPEFSLSTTKTAPPDPFGGSRGDGVGRG